MGGGPSDDQFSVSVSAQDGIVAHEKAHARSAPSLSSLPKVALETVPTFVWLNTDNSRRRRMSAASFLHSFFHQAINAVMLWAVHVQKVLHASEHLFPVKLQTRCDICCACQSSFPFIPTDFGILRAVDPQKSLQPKIVYVCVPVGAAHSRLHILHGFH